MVKFHSLDIIFINVSYPYLLSFYIFLIYTYVNLFKIEIHNGMLALILKGKDDNDDYEKTIRKIKCRKIKNKNDIWTVTSATHYSSHSNMLPNSTCPLNS